MPFVSVISVYALAFVLKADILSTQCNKDDVIWHVWRFGRHGDSNCQSCLSLFKSFKCTLYHCVDGSIWHFKFPKVV